MLVRLGRALQEVAREDRHVVAALVERGDPWSNGAAWRTIPPPIYVVGVEQGAVMSIEAIAEVDEQRPERSPSQVA